MSNSNGTRGSRLVMWERPWLVACCIGITYFVGAVGKVSLQDPVPLTEYYARTLKDYEGLSWKNISRETASPMLRLKGLKPGEFKDLVRLGYPFIVEDCAPKAQLRDMPCSEYARRWPKEHMRAEYTPGQRHINLEDPTWFTEQKPTARATKHLSEGKPLSGPYIWHVKDETDDERTKPDIAAMFPVPYFLNKSVLNVNEAVDSFEFWYVLENGGSQAHSDAYCETTISLQLRGSKLWRLGAFPNITNAFQPYSFHDADIYRHDHFWRPEHEERVDAGECVVFPMGYVHETYVGEGMAGDDGCSVATTFQIQEPQAVHQWKNFLARWGLSHYAREEPCLDRMEPYVFLNSAGLSKHTRSEDDTRAALTAVFAKMDADKDGLLSRKELAPRFRKRNWRPPWTHPRGPMDVEMAISEKAEWMIDDAILYHDDDGDGLVSAAEFESSVMKFLAVRGRLASIKGARRDQSKLYASEQAWIRDHMCASDDCPALEQLKADYDRSTKRPRRSAAKAEL